MAITPQTSHGSFLPIIYMGEFGSKSPIKASLPPDRHRILSCRSYIADPACSPRNRNMPTYHRWPYRHCMTHRSSHTSSICQRLVTHFRIAKPYITFILLNPEIPNRGIHTAIITHLGLFTQYGSNLQHIGKYVFCLLYTSPSPRDRQKSRMPSSA